jgi:hypothetical protein
MASSAAKCQTVEKGTPSRPVDKVASCLRGATARGIAFAAMDEVLCPVTIIATRYGGTYEGGAWAAFPLDPWQVPSRTT